MPLIAGLQSAPDAKTTSLASVFQETYISTIPLLFEPVKDLWNNITKRFDKIFPGETWV